MQSSYVLSQEIRRGRVEMEYVISGADCCVTCGYLICMCMHGGMSFIRYKAVSLVLHDIFTENLISSRLLLEFVLPNH